MFSERQIRVVIKLLSFNPIFIFLVCHINIKTEGTWDNTVNEACLGYYGIRDIHQFLFWDMGY